MNIWQHTNMDKTTRLACKHKLIVCECIEEYMDHIFLRSMLNAWINNICFCFDLTISRANGFYIINKKAGKKPALFERNIFSDYQRSNLTPASTPKNLGGP